MQEVGCSCKTHSPVAARHILLGPAVAARHIVGSRKTHSRVAARHILRRPPVADNHIVRVATAASIEVGDSRISGVVDRTPALGILLS